MCLAVYVILQAVLSNKSALDKGDFYHFMRPLFGDGLIASDSQIWQVNRKFVAPTLNALKVKSLISVFAEGTSKLVQDLSDKTGKSFEPYADVSKTAFGFTIRKYNNTYTVKLFILVIFFYPTCNLRYLRN